MNALSARWQLAFKPADRPKAMGDLESRLADTFPADRDATARQFIATWNLPLAFFAVNQWTAGRRLPVWFDADGANGEACLTLVKAARLWDPDRGIRFSGYAVTAIKNDLSGWHDKQCRRGMTWVPRGDVARITMFDVDVREREAKEGLGEDELRELRELLSHLTARDRKVVNKRFGLDCNALYLHDIGAAMGISKERVRQIEVRAVAKLREVAGVT